MAESLKLELFCMTISVISFWPLDLRIKTVLFVDELPGERSPTTSVMSLLLFETKERRRLSESEPRFPAEEEFLR